MSDWISATIIEDSESDSNKEIPVITVIKKPRK